MRVHLKGVGTPDPDEALPIPVIGGDLQPLVFTPPHGAQFLKAPYVDAGYTHCEIWCVGAAGGRGGDWRELSGSLNPQFMTSYGGSGGGGGLHRVLSLLSLLPDICPVIIGQAGSNGVRGGWHENQLGNPVYDPPTAGGDGGASSFNGATCRASGGKGGAPTPAHNIDGTVRAPGGNGGDGGAGGRAAAGGGGLGSVVAETNGVDGTWDGTVGKGGGGGIGGTYVDIIDPRFPPGGDNSYVKLAGSGGQGSFSFGDISVVGVREARSPDPTENTLLLVPGGGGGAKVNQLFAYGSHAPGFNPNGIVVLRLTKIE